MFVLRLVGQRLNAGANHLPLANRVTELHVRRRVRRILHAASFSDSGLNDVPRETAVMNAVVLYHGGCLAHRLRRRGGASASRDEEYIYSNNFIKELVMYSWTVTTQQPRSGGRFSRSGAASSSLSFCTATNHRFATVNAPHVPKIRMCHTFLCARPLSSPLSDTRRRSTGRSCIAGKP